MADTRAARLRRLWLNVHLWIGVGLALLIVPISISGALLVFHDGIETLLHPARYAVTGKTVTQPPSTYFTNAAAVSQGAQPVLLRFPAEDGAPVVVTSRGRSGEGPPRSLDAYLDPPTGKVLDVVDFRVSFFGFLHRFHENLTIPEYSGRAIVGWVGVAMLISSLTGIWLWWPRNGALLRGLRWTRSPSFNMNLHHMLGFWIALPLAVVSATGIYLGFPQQAREALGSIAAMSPPQRPLAGQPVRQPARSADQALAAARGTVADARPVMISVPMTLRQGESAPPPAWRVVLRDAGGDTVTVFIDDQSGAVRMSRPLAGDRVAQWIRWIHEGSHSGPVWQVIVLLCGIFPPIFVVTGIIIWLRRGGRTARAERQPHLRPAE